MVYSDEIEDKLDKIIPVLKEKYPDIVNERWHALKLLEQDKEITEKYPVDLPDVLDKSYESQIINEKYDFIEEIIHEVLLHKQKQDVFTEKVDRVLTHRIWGVPVFLCIMALVFFLTFFVGDWIKDSLNWASAGFRIPRKTDSPPSARTRSSYRWWWTASSAAWASSSPSCPTSSFSSWRSPFWKIRDICPAWRTSWKG